VRLLIFLIGATFLASCVQTTQLVKDGPVAASEFRTDIFLPDKENANLIYSHTEYSEGSWLQAASWGGGSPKRFLMKVVEFNKTNYVTHRDPLSVSLPRMDHELKKITLNFGKIYNVKGLSGPVSGQAFSAGTSKCLGFYQSLRTHATTGAMGAGSGAIHGYYCAPANDNISDATAMKILSSINFKGKS